MTVNPLHSCIFRAFVLPAERSISVNPGLCIIFRPPSFQMLAIGIVLAGTWHGLGRARDAHCLGADAGRRA